MTGSEVGLVVFIGLLLIVVGIVALRLSQGIPDDYEEDLEAPYSDTPLPREEDDPNVS